MGDYVHGTAGFTHRSSFLEDDLTEIARWSGVGEGHTGLTLATQYLTMRHEEAKQAGSEWVDGASHALGVYQHTLDLTQIGLVLGDDVESALYSLGENWRAVIDLLTHSMPGVCTRPDLSLLHTYTFSKQDWPALATALAYEGELDDLGALETWRDKLYEARKSSMPVFVCNMLMHAIKHDLDEMKIFDKNPGFETNLWDVVHSYIGFDVDKSSREDNVRMAYFQAFYARSDRGREIGHLAQPLLEASCDETLATFWLVHLFKDASSYRGDGTYSALLEAAAWVLSQEKISATMRATALNLRADARLCMNLPGEAVTDIQAAVKLGDETLITYLPDAPTRIET